MLDIILTIFVPKIIEIIIIIMIIIINFIDTKYRLSQQ